MNKLRRVFGENALASCDNQFDKLCRENMGLKLKIDDMSRNRERTIDREYWHASGQLPL